MMRTFLVFSFAVLVGFGALDVAEAMVINAGSEQANNRFYVGPDKAFIGDPYDWSGVGKGWDGSQVRRFATLISPSYYLSATHYQPFGSQILFREDNTGSPSQVYDKAGGVAITNPAWWTDYAGTDSDLFLGRIDGPAHEKLAIYPILLIVDYQTNALDWGAYLGLEHFLYASNSSEGDATKDYLGINVADDFLGISVDGRPTLASQSTYDAPLAQYEAYLQGGDSGGPSFVVVDGRLALIGIHSGVDFSPNRNFDAFVPAYFWSIWQAMENDPSNVAGELPSWIIVYTNIPEPSTLAFLGLALLATLRRRRR